MKILAVDDIKPNRHFLQKLLEGYGYTVETAENGIEALEKARESIPDIIITDVIMPGMDGFQLCRALKNDETLKGIPVLFYSATYIDEESRELALEIGAEEYITKPIEPEKFIKIIGETFEKRERGEIKPAGKPLEEPVYMELYNEILIQKLEEKMLDLERSEATYRSVVEAVDDLVCLIDREYRFLTCNKKSLERFGLTPENVVGRAISEVISDPNDAEFCMKMVREVFETGKQVSREQELDFGGGRRWYSKKMAPVFGTDDSVAAVACVGCDITERKQAEQELARHRKHLEELVSEKTSQLEEKTVELERANIRLQELDRLKSMFIASMSHELRTPLNSIIGFTGLILQGLSGEVSKEANEELGIVYDSAQHLLSLINDVIDISKIEADQLEAYFEEVDLDEVLRGAVAAVSREVEAKKLEIKTDFPEGLSIISDRKRLLQCVLNLLNNAVKFTEHGTIELTAAKEAEILKISVSDTGIGIKEEDIPKLFTPFIRLDSPLKERPLGTGLGLYLTKRIMANVFNGDIMVESQYGRGSTFTLIIPVPPGVVAQ